MLMPSSVVFGSGFGGAQDGSRNCNRANARLGFHYAYKGLAVNTILKSLSLDITRIGDNSFTVSAGRPDFARSPPASPQAPPIRRFQSSRLLIRRY
jgi:hypothetical protein